MAFEKYTQESVFYFSQALALYYWANSTEEPKTTQAITAKVLSTCLLASYSYCKNSEKKTLNSALVMHCLGDLLIELPMIQNKVLTAIPAFFIGHLCYCLHLSKNNASLFSLRFKQKLAMGGFVIGSCFVTKAIQSQTQGLVSQIIPVYALTLGSMVVLAALQKQRAKEKTCFALMYVLSDILIATRMLIKSNPLGKMASSLVTWPFYLFSQSGLVYREASQNLTGHTT